MMEPSKWVSPGGRVHWRRLWFWVGTRFEKAADDKHVVVLCGRWSGLNTPAPADAEVTCGVCLKAANTGAHLPRSAAESAAACRGCGVGDRVCIEYNESGRGIKCCPDCDHRPSAENAATETPVGGHAGGSGLSRPCANGAAEREVPAAPPTGPTTDCPFCGRTAKDCNDSHARGWDGCCMKCDGAGRVNAHRLRMATVIPPGVQHE